MGGDDEAAAASTAAGEMYLLMAPPSFEGVGGTDGTISTIGSS